MAGGVTPRNLGVWCRVGGRGELQLQITFFWLSGAGAGAKLATGEGIILTLHAMPLHNTARYRAFSL